MNKPQRRILKTWVEIFDHPEFCNTGVFDNQEIDSCPFLSEEEAGCYLYGGDELKMNDEYSYDGIYLKNQKCLKAYQFDIKKYNES